MRKKSFHLHCLVNCRSIAGDIFREEYDSVRFNLGVICVGGS